MAFYLYSALVVVIVAASINNCSGVSEEQKAMIMEKLNAKVVACGSELGISNDQLAQWKEGKSPPDDSNKCFLACMFKKSGVLDDKGMYSESSALEKVKPYVPEGREKEANALIKECSSVNAQPVGDGNEGCDRAALLIKCMHHRNEMFAQKKAEFQRVIMTAVKECAKKHNAESSDMVAAVMNPNNFPKDAYKCAWACIFKKVGLVNSSGKYVQEVAIDNIKKYTKKGPKMQEGIEAARNCSSVNDKPVNDSPAEACDRSQLLVTCLMKDILS